MFEFEGYEKVVWVCFGSYERVFSCFIEEVGVFEGEGNVFCWRICRIFFFLIRNKELVCW